MLRTQRKRPEDAILKVGSVVCVYEGFNNKRMIVLETGKWLHTKHGRWRHDLFVGRKYGDRVTTVMKDKRGDWESSCCLLRPTMELWTECLPHRTQIIHLPDISYITLRLGLQSGHTVVEAGTGSGSLTHSLARAVAPLGKVKTFDFHEERSKTAAEEFKQHGIDHIVTAGHRDVCIQHTEGATHADWGFGQLPGTADAIMLDVPSPWLAIKAVHETLNDTGVFCNYSPCIEQVQRTCLALDGLGFSHISTVEVLRREYTEHSIRYKTFESRDDRVQARKRRRLNEDGGDEKDGKDDKDEKEADDEDDAEEAYVETEKEAERFTIPLPTSRGHSAYLTFAHKTPL